MRTKKPGTPGSGNEASSSVAKNTDEKQLFNSRHQKSQSSSKPSARRNTRYGDNEESLINFDLTVDREDDDDISLIVVKKGGKKTRREFSNSRKEYDPCLAAATPLNMAKGSDSEGVVNSNSN